MTIKVIIIKLRNRGAGMEDIERYDFEERFEKLSPEDKLDVSNTLDKLNNKADDLLKRINDRLSKENSEGSE